MKWWAVPVVLAGIVITPIGLFTEDEGYTFLAGAALLVAGVLLLFVLPYLGPRDEQKRTAKQDRAGLALVVAALTTLVVSATIFWKILGGI